MVRKVDGSSGSICKDCSGVGTVRKVDGRHRAGTAREVDGGTGTGTGTVRKVDGIAGTAREVDGGGTSRRTTSARTVRDAASSNG